MVPEDNRSVMHVMSGAMARTPSRCGRLRADVPAGRATARTSWAAASPRWPAAAAARPSDLDYLLRHHIRDLLRNDVLGAAERSRAGCPTRRDLAVAFADIVGFTRLGQEVPESS